MELIEYQKTISREKKFDFLKKFSEKKGATTEDIAWVEKKMGVKLPDEYADFLKEFGGGAFSEGLILPIDRNTDDTEPWSNLFDIFHQNVFENEEEFSEDYLKFYYDENGNYAGFKVENGRCLHPVWIFDQETNKWKDSYYNFFDFLLNHFK